jgi:GntP family gluconate:H+ symporter
VSGFLLGVPVYFDNVFYLLLPLAKAVGRQRPEMYLTAVMAIIVGATMAHSLVPPTPGPLFVANELGVSVGVMMIAGGIVGGIAACVGFGYGLLCRRWVQLSVPGLSEQEIEAERLQTKAARPLPLWLAALPIAIPIGCLGGSEIVKYYASQNEAWSQWSANWEWLALLGDPVLVFLVAAVISILLLGRTSSRSRVGQTISRGLADAGVIVLLTCAGGAFGASLKELHIAEALGNQFSSVASPWGILFTAFLLTAIIRAAQGSATVAMLTSSAIVAPAVANIDLPFHPVYVALAIGCGSKPLPWMNDSGFWQVATMTGMTTSQTLKTFTVALTLMGVTGFGITLIGAWLLPLI